MRLRLPHRMVAMVCAGLVTMSLAACTRNAADAKPTISAGVPPAVTVAAADFPSFWVAERVGGAAIDLRLTEAAELAASDADLIAYAPGIDPAVDAAVADLPDARVVDVMGDVSLLASVRDPQVKDPYAWFDPVNVATMAQTVGRAMGQASGTEFEALQYYGLRALSVQSDALAVDQRLQDQFNPCQIATLVVEAPVLTYLAKAYAFDQVPLIEWEPGQEPVEAIYYTLEAAPAVREAAAAAGVRALPVDTLTEGAPNDDLLQGVLDIADEIASAQDCPLQTPSATDRPG